MFGRDPVLPLNTLLGPKMKYLGNDINILSLEAMKNMFEIAATNVKIARKMGDPRIAPYLLNCNHEIQYWSKTTPKDHLILNMWEAIELLPLKETK